MAADERNKPMPGFTPTQSETKDSAADKQARAAARELARDLELEAEHLELAAETANSHRQASALSFCVDDMRVAARRLRRLATEYPGPYPEPLRMAVMDLWQAKRALREAGAEAAADSVGVLLHQMEAINSAWPVRDVAA
jgi:hypothetical protein